MIAKNEAETGMVRMDDIRELAHASASSGFFPGIKTPEQALVLMALAQAEGIAPIQAVMRYDVIQGRPAKKAQAMLADFMVAGGKVVWLQHSEDCCEATFSHPSGGEITVKWDVEKAKKAELLGKDNWKKYRENMLHARCVSSGVRFVCPAATGGLYTPEEVADFTADKFASLPKEERSPARDADFTPVPEAPKAASKLPPELENVPEFVAMIPAALTKPNAFAAMRGLESVRFIDMQVADLELIISTCQDTRPKAPHPTLKTWLLAIEAAATGALRDAKMELELSPEVGMVKDAFGVK